MRTDTWVMCELAKRLGAGDKFAFTSSREVFDELRIASADTVNDYYGITYERLEETGGIMWPCPSTDHPGTPRLFEGGRTYHPDGKIHMQVVEWHAPMDPYNEEYPSPSPPAAPSRTSSPATRPAAWAPSSNRPRAPGWRSTPRTATGTAIRSG